MPARKCAENAVWPEFCSHCSHCSKRSGNALSPCLCGVPTVPTVTTQKSERGKECTQSVKWSMHIIGRGVAAVFAVGRALWCCPWCVLGPVECCPLCLPWGLMRRAGGAWKVWGAHAGNRPVPHFFACEGFGRGGICADVPPLFQKVPPFVPPSTPGFRHTSSHVHALVKATSHREKEKGRKLVEASGLICGARGRNRTGTPCGGGF